MGPAKHWLLRTRKFAGPTRSSSPVPTPLRRDFWRLVWSRGDRIGIWAPNCAEWTIAQFATAKAGLILVNINPAYRLSELEHVLRAVGCRALITAARFKTSDYIAMIRELVPELGTGSGELKSSRLPELRHVISIGNGSYAGCLAFDRVLERGKQTGSQRLDSVAATIQMDDAVNIQFTSGTTGLPKGATLSHHNLINNAFFVGEATGIEPGSRVCIPVPLYHCFGMVMGNLGCVTHAATMVYPSESFDPLKTLETVEAERCDVLYGVPTMFIAQLNHPEFSRFDLRSLRRGIMAGAPCPIEVMKEVGSNNAHERDHDRLRDDRNQSGELPEQPRRSAGAARLNGRSDTAASGSQDRRPRRPDRAARRSRRTLHQGIFGHARLLE